MKKNEIVGMKELEKTIKKLGQLPQKTVTISAKKGASIVLKAARKKAPKATGNLRKGIVLKGEKARIKGKKVYQITFNSSMNDIFQKKTKTGLVKRKVKGENKDVQGNYYYPASQEYGWRTPKGKTAGKHFMKEAAISNKKRVEDTIIETLSKEIDKLK